MEKSGLLLLQRNTMLPKGTENMLRIAAAILLLAVAVFAGGEEPSTEVAVGICENKAVMEETSRVFLSKVPDSEKEDTLEEVELDAVWRAGMLGVVVMLLLQLVVVESLMLGVFGETVITVKILAYLYCCSGLISAALGIWVLCYVGAYAAVCVVNVMGVQGATAGGVAMTAGATVATGAVAIVAERAGRAVKEDIKTKLAGATMGVFTIILCVVMALL